MESVTENSENIGKTFFDELMSNLNVSEETKMEALDLFKKILSSKGRIKKFKGSNFEIDGKTFEEFNEEEKNILDISDMIISYLYSKIKIKKNIGYYKCGNNFRIVSNKMDKILKITNIDYIDYSDNGDSINLDLSDFEL